MAEVDKAEAAGWDWRKTAWKGAKTFALVLSAQLAPLAVEAVSKALMDEKLINATLRDAGAPVAVVTAGTALIVAAGKMLANWWAHRNGAK